MAHEVLTVKLCQLDDRMGRLHSRIHMSETAGHDQLRQEINALERECAQEELVLRETLGRSRSGMVSVLARGYRQVEQIVQQAREQMEALAADSPEKGAVAEEKILLAEYALDFAHQAADRALLLSMQAIDAQLLREEEEERSQL